MKCNIFCDILKEAKGSDGMILTVDVGNTNITFGGFEKDELRFVSRISANMQRTMITTLSKLASSMVSLPALKKSKYFPNCHQRKFLLQKYLVVSMHQLHH